MCTFRADLDSLGRSLAPSQLASVEAFAAARRNSPEFYHGGKIRFPPYSLLALCGFEPAWDAPLAVIVELKPDSPGPVRIETVEGEAAEVTLRALHVERQLPYFLTSVGCGDPPRIAPGEIPLLRLVGRDRPDRLVDLLGQALRLQNPALHGKGE